ncbi:ABC transporter ATP-binding protein [Nonomuraea purpurea]|uniref:ABC transporter ATP-binding protein n=1 Tax=Nonomuraea purpurea TaxID=1849276 RepID=A0ABV8G564_9ACTN
MIEAVGLTKTYGDTVAVDGLSFSVPPGRVTGFLGPNGAGKSTTMRMILGLDNPTAGHALIAGRRYRDLRRPLRTVGALLDAAWVHPNRSARTHLRWLARSNGIPAGRAEEVLEAVGLAPAADRLAGGFSLGMAQRLGIAGALLGDPEVLLFDEPVNGLDPEGVRWIRGLMHRLADEGRTVLVSSHLLSEMALTAQDLIVIGRGRLIAQCGVEEFVARATESSVRVRTPDAARLRALLEGEGAAVHDEDGALIVTGAESSFIGEMCAANGVVLHELSLLRGSLEEAFMRLTGDALDYQAVQEQEGAGR